MKPAEVQEKIKTLNNGNEFGVLVQAEEETKPWEKIKPEQKLAKTDFPEIVTIVKANLIASRKTNTLVLVHTQALLSQWHKSLLQFLSINEPLLEPPIKKRGRKKKHSIIGQLGAGKNTLTGVVDIAIMQSLINDQEAKDLVKDYGMIIVDECHHVPAFNFEKILKTTNAKHVYGLTATPIRQDGHHPIIFMQCGPIRYSVDAKTQAEKHPRAQLPNMQGACTVFMKIKKKC